MAKGKRAKVENEQTNLIRDKLASRYKGLKTDIQAAKEGRLNIEQLEQLIEKLNQPVKVSETLAVTIADCHPSTGGYKRALPKGYQPDLTAIPKILTELQSLLKPVALETPDPEKMKDNIFAMVEEYLAHPSKKLATQIKQYSHDLTNQAYEEAKQKFPGKKISADEYGPIILQKIEDQAKEAMSYSTRMIVNESYTKQSDDIDKPYIFKISKEQQQTVRGLIDQSMDEKMHPEGLISAFGDYMERRLASKISHLEGTEAAAYDHNAKLYLKAKELVGRGEHEVAGIVAQGCDQIKSELTSSQDADQKFGNIKDVLVGIRENPKVQEHRGLLKTVLTNFLLIVSGVGGIYLAATAEKRGSFFYRPQTDTENKAEDFEKDMDKEGPQAS